MKTAKLPLFTGYAPSLLPPIDERSSDAPLASFYKVRIFHHNLELAWATARLFRMVVVHVHCVRNKKLVVVVLLERILRDHLTENRREKTRNRSDHSAPRPRTL